MIKYFFIWRLWLFIPLFLANSFLQVRPDSKFTTLWKYVNPYSFVKNQMIYPWANFDGVHYLAIASRGYIDEGRFLPLYPSVISYFAKSFSLSTELKPYGLAVFLSGFFISNISFILSMVYLYKLLRLDFNEEKINNFAILFLLFPTAFFFGAIYSESIFLLFCVLSLYFARKRNWWVTVSFLMLASITRLSGLLLIFPLLYEYFQLEIKNISTIIFSKKFLIKNRQLLLFLLSPLFLIFYSHFNLSNWGDSLYFVHAHGALGNSREVLGIVFPLITVYRYLTIFITVSFSQYEFWIALLEFLSLVFVLYGLFLILKLKLRNTYLIYCLAMLSLPIFSGTLSGFPRYILPIFPIFLAYSLHFEKHKNIKKLFLVFSLLLQALLLGLFARSYFVA